MVNLLAVIPNQTDATSFYRGGGPLQHLKRKYNINVNLVSQYNWFTTGFSDVVFMQRPFRQTDVQIAEMAKSLNIPVWIDYDDDLFNLTTDNPAYEVYGQESIQNNIKKVMSLANFITVSTDDLKYKAEKYLKGKVMTINNAFNSHLIPRIKSEKRNPLIMWRGSPTHHRDVTTLAQPIMELSHEYNNWGWEFIGDRLWFMTDQMPHERTIITEALDIIDYHQHIAVRAPSIFIVPLCNNTFNHSKSNIAWIEAIYAGAVCVAPDWPEWRRKGCLNYKDSEDFKDVMKELMDGKHNIEELNKQGEQEIIEKYNIDFTNEQRLAVLAALCPHKFPKLQK